MFSNFFKDKFPEYKQVATAPQAKSNDLYRIGVTTDGLTTLTLTGENGFSMTLTMNAPSVVQMIRLLEATLPPQEEAAADGHA